MLDRVFLPWLVEDVACQAAKGHQFQDKSSSCSSWCPGGESCRAPCLCSASVRTTVSSGAKLALALGGVSPSPSSSEENVKDSSCPTAAALWGSRTAGAFRALLLCPAFGRPRLSGAPLHEWSDMNRSRDCLVMAY